MGGKKKGIALCFLLVIVPEARKCEQIPQLRVLSAPGWLLAGQLLASPLFCG